MKKQLTEQALIKKLTKLDRDDLTELIVSLFRDNRDVRDRISCMFLGEDYKTVLLNQHKEKLREIFDPIDFMDTYPSLEDAKRVLCEFGKVCGDLDSCGDLSLYLAECASDFTKTYGDMDDEFYDTLLEAYRDAVLIARDNEQLYTLWKDRLRRIYLASFDFGWDMDTLISDEYFTIPWVDPE